MKSSFFIHSTPTPVMMILLLLSISDPIASSSPSDESLGAALKNESFELVLGTTIEPNSNSTEAVPYFVAEIKTIIGFASSIKSMYEEFDKLLNPAVTPKYTVDDVMNRINEQFSKVSQDLNEIQTTLNENQMAVYGNVELALNNAFNDMRLTNTIQLKSRAINLFDRLGEFMKGMLGKFNILPDLLKTVSGLYDCRTTDMQKKMNEFIAMVHVGTGGLAYYDRAINNKAIFDGEKLSNDLAENYEKIRKRFQEVLNSCASLDKAVIDKYINKILDVNQADHVQTADVSKLLYKRFDDIYKSARPDIVWVFYTAWKYDAVSGDKSAGSSAKSMHMLYEGAGSYGVTKNGGWTVLWVGHPLPAPAKWLDVNVEGLREVIKAERNNWREDGNYIRNAYNLEKRMSWSLFTGRKPVFILIAVYPTLSATMGTPLIGERMNIFQKRISDIAWQFTWSRTWVVIDFIIF